jgi:hypothetical protein
MPLPAAWQTWRPYRLLKGLARAVAIAHDWSEGQSDGDASSAWLVEHRVSSVEAESKRCSRAGQRPFHGTSRRSSARMP